MTCQGCLGCSLNEWCSGMFGGTAFMGKFLTLALCETDTPVL